MFSPATSGLGVQRRNQFYGPNYFDTDFTVMKNFRIPHWSPENWALGCSSSTCLTIQTLISRSETFLIRSFGSIITTVSTPTSILGSFLGGDASPRLIQVKASLTF